MKRVAKLPVSGPFGKLYEHINELHDLIESFRPVVSVGTLTAHTTRGVSRRGLGGGEEETPAELEIQKFFFYENKGDYLRCYEWADPEPSEANRVYVNVAKPLDLRKSTWDGKASSEKWWVTYSFPTNGWTRRTTAGVVTGVIHPQLIYDEIISPAYEIGKYIYGIKEVTGGTGVKDESDENVVWIDLNLDARHWDFAIEPMPFCYNGQIFWGIWRLRGPTTL